MIDIEEHELIHPYLVEQGKISADERIECSNLPGGVSCRTVLVRRAKGPDIVLKQALEFLRVAEVWKGDPARVAREAEAMRVLGQLLEPGQVPELLFEDESQHLIAMSAVAEPHENWKHMLLREEVSLELVGEFGELLGTIHGASSKRAEEFALRFADRSQFESLRVDPYYRFTANALPELKPWFEQLISDTKATRVALVHGDFSPKNVLIRNDACVLLDHEVAHWGDPAFDIGFATAHFFGKANHLVQHRQDFADAALAFFDGWRSAVRDPSWFDDVTARCVRHSLACGLARVSGKSLLEYLDDAKRDRQRDALLGLIEDEPGDYNELVERFVEALS